MHHGGAGLAGDLRERLLARPETAARFTAGALDGITMCAGMPRSRAASASAAAWLPEECVATPRRASSSESDATALQAPRNLNAPTFCRFSHLKNTRAPARSSTLRLVRTGVLWACGAMRSAARWTSSRVGAGMPGG
jgi:hypothetical protein